MRNNLIRKVKTKKIKKLPINISALSFHGAVSIKNGQHITAEYTHNAGFERSSTAVSVKTGK